MGVIEEKCKIDKMGGETGAQSERRDTVAGKASMFNVAQGDDQA